MYIKATPLIGKDVINLTNGTKVESVSKVMYDPQQRKILGVVVDEKGWFSEAKVLLFEEIASIGEDAVMINSEEAIKKASEVPASVARIATEDKTITQTKILTEQGKELGTLTDLYFDTETGQVVQFEVSQGMKDAQTGRKVVAVDQVVTIGENSIIVKSSTQQLLEQQQAPGGLEKAAEVVSTKTQEVAHQAQQKTGQVANNPKLTQAKEETKTVLQDIGSIAAEKAKDLRGQLHTQAQKARQDK